MSIFNWSGQPIRNLLVYLTVVMGLFCHGQLATAQDYSWTLPDGFKWPQFDRPDPKPTDHLQFDGLLLLEKNRVIHQIELDHSAVKWSDQVLQVSVGYMERWSPGDHYVMLPNGYQTEPDYAVAFINTLRIKFPKKFDPESTEVMRSTNRLEYTLYRENEHLVVAKGDERRWYFESPNGGETWRLHYIERIKSPGLYTTLEYEGELAIAVRFPNGQKAVITYENSLVSRIDTPFGESLRLARGAGGFVKEASLFIHRSVDDPQDMAAAPKDYVLHRRYRYTHNAQGQMTQYESYDGSIYHMMYEHEISQKNRSKEETYLATVRRQGDEVFKYRKDEFLASTGEWVVSRGFGGGDQTAASALLEFKSRKVPVNRRWSSISYMDMKQGVQLARTFDKLGNPVAQVTSSGQTSSSTFNEMGLPTQTTSSGLVSAIDYNDFGQETRRLSPDGSESLYRYDNHARLREEVAPGGVTITRDYDDNGLATSIRRQNRESKFTYNDWGWLTRMQRSNGLVDEWSYNAIGQITCHTLTRTLRGGVSATIIYIAVYKNNRLDAIQRIDSDKQELLWARYFYDKEGRLVRKDKEGEIDTVYQYDRFGRLTNESSPAGRSHVWTYHPNGKIKSDRMWGKGLSPTVMMFDVNGKQVGTSN